MIRTYLEFELVPGGAEVLRSVFERHQILETSAAQPGCRSAELTFSDDESLAIVTALWDDEDAYAVWTSRNDRGDLGVEIQPALKQSITASTTGRVFRVGLSAAATD